MTGPVDALLAFWRRRVHARMRDSRRRKDEFERGRALGEAEGRAFCAKELEQLVATVDAEARGS